jgi:hypothetical protein
LRQQNVAVAERENNIVPVKKVITIELWFSVVIVRIRVISSSGKSDVMNGSTIVALLIIVVIGCSSAQLVQRERYLMLVSTVKKNFGACGILKNILQD